jgi:hypothetical protein
LAAASLESQKLAALCGGLQLLPANIHRLWRLEALAAISLDAADRTGRRDPGPDDVRKLVNAGALGALADQQEDPFDDVIAEEVAFHHGSFLVGRGLAGGSVDDLRSLVKTTLLSPLLPADRRNELTRTVAAVLHLSDHVLRTAGLRRNLAPDQRAGMGATIPGVTTARQLAARVTFATEQIQEVTGANDLAPLEPLIAPSVVTAFTTERIMQGAPNRWPLRRYGDVLVLAEPFSLALALRHHLTLAALDEVGPAALAQVFGLAVDEGAHDALHHLGGRVGPYSVTARAVSRPWTEIAVPIDDGLQLRCLVVADGFTGIQAEDPYAMWDRNDALDSAHDYLETDATSTDDEILGLLVGAPAGGSAFMGTRDSQRANLRVQVLGLADLATICFLESGDPLGPWKWVRASDSVTGQVLSWGSLDLYGVYRSQERSLATLSGATFVSIAPNSGADRRIEYKTIRDLHGARFVDGTVREIRRTEPTEKRSRIYHPVELGDRLRLFVAELPLDIWVVGPKENVIETWSHVNSVAYWLDQLAEPLGEIFEQLASRLSCAAIEVDLVDPLAWAEPTNDPGDGEPATWEVAGNSVVLCLGLPIARLLTRPTNEADRIIVRSICQALDLLAREGGMSGISKATIEAAVERAAPPGYKKHLIGMPREGNELAEEADMPPRPVQEADVSRAREQLSTHLESFGWRDEEVPHDRRDELLKDSVAFLFREFCARLDKSAPDGLLDRAIIENERLVAESERRRAMLPARLATEPESAQDLREEVANEAKAAIACRLLIEYVAAQPPMGEIPWSLRRHDECMALVAELLDWAYLDDAVNAGLSATDLLIRDDGQLRLVELGRYERGQSSFFDSLLSDMKEASASIFPKRFQSGDESDAREPNSTLVRLNGPLASEAGLNVEGLVNLLHGAAYIVRQADVQMITLKKQDAIKRLSETIGEDAESVTRAVDYLTLGPRDSFLDPPSGSTRDVLPSRSSRRWSYVRRPFVRVDTTEGPSLTWGRRHPLATLRVLIGQLLSGRYQHLAEGPELRTALGTIASETGHEFEARVDALFKASDIKTFLACTSIGSDSLRRTEDGDLGDIDILACDSRRRTLWVVECKDLAGAITTSDIVDEMTEHFGAGDTTTVARLSARVRWVTARRAGALKMFAQESSANSWKVRGAFVTSAPVVAPYITDLPFPIIPVEQLSDWLTRAVEHGSRRRRRRRK